MCNMRRYWPLLGGLAVLALFLGAHYWGWQGTGWAWPMSRGAWGMGFMGIPMILVWVLVLAVFWGLFGRGCASHSAPSSPGKSESALEILSQRYAKGEISREQYLAMRQDVENR